MTEGESASMFECLAERVNGNAALVRRGRYVNCTMLLEADEERHLVRIAEGAVAEISKSGSLMTDFTFGLRAPREAWEKFLAAKPPPGFTDLFALQRKKLLRIEGDLHPFMANLRYFKDVLACARQRKAA
jgi:hypothetical protein